MSLRQQYIDEFRQLEGVMEPISREQKQRMAWLVREIRRCHCRNCGGEYDSAKSRGDYKGFCSAKCQHAKARYLGFRPKKGSEYQVLKSAGCIGDLHVVQ